MNCVNLLLTSKILSKLLCKHNSRLRTVRVSQNVYPSHESLGQTSSPSQLFPLAQESQHDFLWHFSHNSLQVSTFTLYLLLSQWQTKGALHLTSHLESSQSQLLYFTGQLSHETISCFGSQQAR